MQTISRLFLILALGPSLTLTTGCSKSQNDHTEAPDEAGDPLSELQAIPDQIQAEVDTVLQPINDVDLVMEQVSSAPERWNIDLASLKTALLANLSADVEDGEVTVELDVEGLSDEAKAEVETLLGRVRAIKTGLIQTPERAATASKNIVAQGARATALVGKLQAKYQAKLANPLATAAQKAEIQAEIDGIMQLKNDVMVTVEDAKSTVTELPQRGQAALVKLKTAFTSL